MAGRECTPHSRGSHQESPPVGRPRTVRSPLPKSIRMSLLQTDTARSVARTVMAQLIVERMVSAATRR